MRDGQVHRLVWSGDFRTTVPLEWSLVKGWSISNEAAFVEVAAAASASAGATVELLVKRRGRFQLQVSRRRSKTVLSLRRTGEREIIASAEAGAGVRSSVRLPQVSAKRPSLDKYLLKPLSRPLLARANRILSAAVVRRFEVRISVEASRHRGQLRFWRAEWSKFSQSSVRSIHRDVLRGRLPSPLPGVRLSGMFQKVSENSIQVALNVFDWLAFRVKKSKRKTTQVSLTPEGDLLFKRATSIEKLRETKHSRQVAAVLLRELGKQAGWSSLRWSLDREGRFDRKRLLTWLRLGLHSGILDSARLSGRERFPLRLRLMIVTEFSKKGLAEIRRGNPEQWWQVLIRVLEIQAPRRYAQPSYWRDWVDFPDVRRVIDLNPVHGHLASHYPIGGRTTAQRRRVAAEYLRARRFIRLLSGWQKRDPERLLKFLSARLDRKGFLFFNLLCPGELKRGAALVQGDLESSWGDTTLLVE